MKTSHFKRILFVASSKSNTNRYLLESVQRFISNESTINNSKQRDTFLNKYTDLVSRQVINSDPRQKSIVLKLNDFCNEVLVEFDQEKRVKKQLFSLKNLFSSSKQTKPKPRVRSIYLYGGVGCGKTMLMDMVYETLPSHILKERIHFNKFMFNVHQNIHRIKQENKQTNNKRDALSMLVDELIRNVHLLFFDEFQVTDIADAMLMQRLFTALFEKGIILFSTSNRVPDDLYKNGLQRELFLPFIDSIYEYCDVIPLISPTDYRQLKNTTHNRLYFNSDTEKDVLDRVVAHFILEQDNKQVDIENIDNSQENQLAKLEKRSMDILGREVHFERTYKYVLDTNFAFICEEARSAVDYLEICKQFDVIILRDIPSINLKNVDSLRRLIVFVDTVYDNKIKLVLSGKAATLTGLFDFASKKREKIHRLQEKSQEQEQASLFTVEEELFAVDRTISRLVEMQSESYLKQLIKRN